MDSTAAIILILLSLVGVVLTALTLPGAWLTLITAVVIRLWRPELLEWSTIAVCVGIALLAEIIEFFASAAGASKAGGSKRGALGAVVGSLIGAILGAPFLLFIGAIIGAVIGAGVGAIVAERGLVGKTWGESLKIGRGAAIGRFWATIVKVALAGAIAVILSVAVLR